MRIVLDKVGKRYGDKLLFSDISAEISERQCVAVTGCNGSGKSTLLKIIAGLIRPSSGYICFSSDNTLDSGQRRDYAGLVSPDMAMYSALSGVENIVFWAKMRRIACSQAEAAELCRQFGLGEAGRERVNTYSTGMCQRLKLAVIKVINPPVWLLDEPSSNLDDNGKILVKELIESAMKQNAAVILATNEKEEVLYASSKIKL